MLSEFLSQNSFVASVAANGVEGLRAALAGPCSCILLDLMLPYKSGDEVLKELRSVSDAPVIVMSAKGLTQSKIDLKVTMPEKAAVWVYDENRGAPAAFSIDSGEQTFVLPFAGFIVFAGDAGAEFKLA